MNLMTVFLQAPAAAPGGGSMMWILLIAMFAISPQRLGIT